MRIGVDIDDVIAECAAPYLRAFAKEFGVDLGDGTLGWPLLDSFTQIPKQKKDEFRMNLYDGTFFSELECYPGCTDALPRLVAAGHEVHFITARSERRRRITAEWLERKGLLRHAASLQLKPIGDFVPRSYDSSGSGEYKAAVARRLELDRFCEDDPIIARRLVDERVPVFLFDRPWNGDLAHPLVHRVRDWDEVVRELVPEHPGAQRA
ncbi:MAG: hypothetical protein E6I87_05845 [Chloroflexi bacterium]|nr:MAG: hypothetical protein E6I87_05845 [Chloroflexota bacterium]